MIKVENLNCLRKALPAVVYRTFLVLVLTAVSSAQAENWPHWRGPYFNGSTSEKDLPAKWSTTENIAWSASLPGAAASTPIVWETRVLLSGVDDARDTLQAMCFDRVGGKLLWSRDVARGVRQDPTDCQHPAATAELSVRIHKYDFPIRTRPLL